MTCVPTAVGILVIGPHIRLLWSTFVCEKVVINVYWRCLLGCSLYVHVALWQLTTKQRLQCSQPKFWFVARQAWGLDQILPRALLSLNSALSRGDRVSRHLRLILGTIFADTQLLVSRHHEQHQQPCSCPRARLQSANGFYKTVYSWTPIEGRCRPCRDKNVWNRISKVLPQAVVFAIKRTNFSQIFNVLRLQAAVARPTQRLQIAGNSWPKLTPPPIRDV